VIENGRPPALTEVQTATIDLGAPRRIHVSVAVDPLATVLTSVAELFGPLSGRLPRSFQARGRQLARAVDMAALAILWADHSRRLADFLGPRQATGPSTIATRLEQLRSTPTGQVTEDIAAVSASHRAAEVAAWLEEPDRQLARFVGALRDFANAVVAPLYPHLEQRLRREAIGYSQTLVTDGVAQLLLDLNPRISYHDGRLRVCHPIQWTHPPTGLVLCPMSCSSRTILTAAGETNVLSFASGDLTVRSTAKPTQIWPDPLANLVGASRAAIARNLTTPGTTTELAIALQLSLSTVSHHLDTLRTSDIVTSQRTGQSVYYRLTDRGRDLVNLLTEGRPR
jgi:DNA-binding transcriptional ArsR family regulator